MTKPKRPIADRADPTPERLAKAGEAFVLGHTGMATIRDAPLEWAHHRKIITDRHYNAGVKHRLQ